MPCYIAWDLSTSHRYFAASHIHWPETCHKFTVVALLFGCTLVLFFAVDYRIRVRIKRTDASFRQGLAGDMFLVLTANSLQLHHIATGTVCRQCYKFWQWCRIVKTNIKCSLRCSNFFGCAYSAEIHTWFWVVNTFSSAQWILLLGKCCLDYILLY